MMPEIFYSNTYVKVHCAPMCGLVINENPYELIFVLRYPYRSFPWERIGIHVLDSRGLHDGHCYIQGFI